MSCGREGLFTAGYLGIGPVINRTLMEDHGLSEATAKVLSCGSVRFCKLDCFSHMHLNYPYSGANSTVVDTPTGIAE